MQSNPVLVVLRLYSTYNIVTRRVHRTPVLSEPVPKRDTFRRRFQNNQRLRLLVDYTVHIDSEFNLLPKHPIIKNQNRRHPTSASHHLRGSEKICPVASMHRGGVEPISTQYNQYLTRMMKRPSVPHTTGALSPLHRGR